MSKQHYCIAMFEIRDFTKVSVYFKESH